MNELRKNHFPECIPEVCRVCRERCDASSRPQHDFAKDADYAEARELALAEILSRNPGISARKSPRNEMPDIEVSDERTGEVICYVEVKALKRAFMRVGQVLPASGLTPSETVELNTSDLLRYGRIRRESGKPVFVLWRISERPCLTPDGGFRCFFGGVDDLLRIHERTRAERTYRRKTRAGDVVNGEHKGVVVNFHFSIHELAEARPENGLCEILAQVPAAERFGTARTPAGPGTARTPAGPCADRQKGDCA